jgi:hypothetical protein
MSDVFQSQSRVTPAERFLGLTGHPGPFELLGVATAALNQEQIVLALEARLVTLNEHAEGLTPEADELRLSLHAAAAQLLDPLVRDHLISAWSNESDRSRAARLELERDAILVLGSMGGWHHASLRRLAILAHAKGIASSELADVLQGLTRRGPLQSTVNGASRPRAAAQGNAAAMTRVMVSASATGGPATPASDVRREEIDPLVTLVKRVAIVGGGLIAFLIVLAVVILRIVAPPVTETPSGVPVAQASPARLSNGDEDLVATVGPAPVVKAADPDATLRVLRAAAGDLDGERDAALARLIAGLETWARTWPDWSTDRTQAATAALLDAMYKLAPDVARSTQLLDAVARPSQMDAVDPGEIMRSAWSAGVLTRLVGERDLPIGVATRVRDATSVAFPGVGVPVETTFAAGALSRLSVISKSLSQPGQCEPRAWQAWRTAVAGATLTDMAARQRAVLLGLEATMLASNEPSGGEAYMASVAELVAALSWKKTDESRAWLLRWFATPAYSSGDLHALTKAMALKSTAEGVDISMVLPPDAADRIRAEMRDRYALAWGMGGGQDRKAASAQWLTAADARLGSEMPGTTSEQLASALVLSRLSQAAVLAYSGEPQLAQNLIDGLDQDIPVVNRGGVAQPVAAQASRISDWGVKYAAAQAAIQTRVDLLAQLSRIEELGPGDAELVVHDAVSGSQSSVRRAAREATKRLIGQRWIVNAVLEALPTMPLTVDNAELIDAASGGPLPSLRDPRWRHEARRLLVQRCLEFIAKGGEGAAIDLIAGKLAESYEGRSAAGRAGGSGTVGLTPEQAADELIRRWRQEAEAMVPSGREPMSMDTVKRRADARERLAVGPVQRFVARQTTLVEMMAFAIVAERPARSADVRRTVDAFNSASRAAAHVALQVWASERAMVELWRVRLDEGAAGGGA